MARKRWLVFGIGLLILSLIGSAIAVAFYIEHLPERLSQHETIVLGQSRLVLGSTAALRVLVRDTRDGAPLPGARVKVLLRPTDVGRSGAGRAVFEGTTQENGTLDVSFTVPDDGAGARGAEARGAEAHTLVVETSSALGSDRVEQPVTVARDYRLLVTSDKPLYQPGQVIHLRALALGSFDRLPAAHQDIELTVADGKGNTVFRKTVTASAFGVASTDFQLADEVNGGSYKITAKLGDTVSEKTVTVEHYVLPKFDVVVETDRTYYRPGERVEGTLTARYFFGKDVAGGAVALEGYTFDVERNVAVQIEGETDDAGAFSFEFDLPAYVAGSELEEGRARFYVEARVTDQTGHTEVGQLSLPVAQSALVIDAIPEGGRLRPGVENILYLLTSYPDGAPAEAAVTVTLNDTGERLVVQTGRYGLAELPIVPTSSYMSLVIEAQDAAGARARRAFSFEGEGGDDAVLLRPDGAVYRVGDTMVLSVLSAQRQGTVYVDIVREGQTVSTRAVDIADGHAEIAVDLTPDLYGTLALHAYKIRRNGHIVRDTRLVVVDEADELAVSLRAGAETYRPGEDADLHVRVGDGAAAGVRAALGLAVVDESLFALAEQDPGFAKLYFMLEQELLTPKYELHGFSIPDLVRDPCREGGDPETCPPPLRGAQTGAGKAALASALSDADPFSLRANSHEQAMARARTRQHQLYGAFAATLGGMFALLSVATMALSFVSVVRDDRFWRSLGLGVATLVVMGLSLFGILWLADEVFWRLEDLILTMVMASVGCAGVVGIVSLIVSAIRRRDGLLGIMIVLLTLAVALGVGAIWAAARADVTPPSWTLYGALFTSLLFPLAYVVRGAGDIWQRRVITGLAALAVGIALLTATTTVVALTTIGRAQTENVALAEPGMWAADAEAPALMGRAVMQDAAVAVEKRVEVEEAGAAPREETAQSSTAPRLRQYFPETMLWLPDEVTDADGELRLSFPVADSITTWRVTALASSQDGRLGSATAPLRVFQDFFIDLDLPASLTVGDEIAVPVGVFNYLPESQTVRLEVEGAAWFELLDDPVKEIQIAPNEIDVVSFRIRARDFGRQPFQVTAYGSAMSDAIRKEIRVFPDGKELRFSSSDRLSPTAPVTERVQLPADVIAGTQKLTVKIYPGVVSQLVEGLDALLRMPYGCFEQTSSATYPNVLVLDYLKTTGQTSPEVQMEAEQYINLGYQRLMTFEVNGEPGGFSLFGDAPADPMLTAYGLQEFGDMSRVYDVDPALIARIAEWLFAHQASDGSWQGVAGFHETNLTNQTGRIPVTAFVVWGLADAGYGDDGRTQRGADFLRESASQADTAYDLALVANALVAVDLQTGGVSSATAAVLDRLAGMAQREGTSVYWEPGRETYMGGYGISGRLETTASVALALLRAGHDPELANAALTYLVRNKDTFGTWETTSATVMALKALIESVRAGTEDVDASITVMVNGAQTRRVRVMPETLDVVQTLVFADAELGSENEVTLAMEGRGSLMYQVTTSYVLPWASLDRYPEFVGDQDLVTIDVVYDRTELSVDDTVGVDVTVTLNEPEGAAEQSIIDLGVPPGFSVETEDLARLVAGYRDLPEGYVGARIRRFELTGRQIILYVTDLNGAEPLSFNYRLRAKYPLIAQTPASSAYDYYNPATAGEVAPTTLTVVE
ncbi:MAG: alpha-2-macroglobulin family protein [Anaerolineae bacterium]